MNAEFSDLDINGDGSLSFNEYKTAFPSSEKKGFDFLDTSKDHDEWHEFKAAHGLKHIE